MNRRAFTVGVAATLAAPALAQARTPRPPPVLTGPRRAEQQAPARFLLVVLHGIGSNGEDILTRIGNLQSFAPSAELVAPTGPVSMGDSKYSWGPVPGGGLRQPSNAQCAAAINNYCDAELARLNLTPDRLILFGFSQGSLVALNLGLRRTPSPAAIIGFSGSYLTRDPLGPGKPPVLLVHGAEDELVASRDDKAVVKRLTAEGIPVESHTLEGLAHGIDQRGIDLAGELLRRVTA